MGATIAKDGELIVVRLTGVLRKDELDAIQWGEAAKIPPDARLNALVLAEAFAGWRRGDTWDDVSFIAAHGGRIGKIALVAEPRWEDRLLMFMGAGFRRTQVRFFPLEQLDEARAWLAETMPAAGPSAP